MVKSTKSAVQHLRENLGENLGEFFQVFPAHSKKSTQVFTQVFTPVFTPAFLQLFVLLLSVQVPLLDVCFSAPSAVLRWPASVGCIPVFAPTAPLRCPFFLAGALGNLASGGGPFAFQAAASLGCPCGCGCLVLAVVQRFQQLGGCLPLSSAIASCSRLAVASCGWLLDMRCRQAAAAYSSPRSTAECQWAMVLSKGWA